MFTERYCPSLLQDSRPEAERAPRSLPASPAKIALSSGFHIQVTKDEDVRDMTKDELDKGLLATIAREVIHENKVKGKLHKV